MKKSKGKRKPSFFFCLSGGTKRWSSGIGVGSRWRRSEADDGPFLLHRRRLLRLGPAEADTTAASRPRTSDGDGDADNEMAATAAARRSDGGDDEIKRRRRHEVKGASV
ncbi:hypothetical protein LINPERHAP1_LOCUS14182 [Linum perenne]